jgi:maltooligosyltrehalose trehalohydrolase
MQQGWLFTGQLSPHLGRPRGTSPVPLASTQFVHCIQNHDQIGNRAFGDRLCATVDTAAFKAMSALLLLGPATPLLFMGQEWNATTPFLFFTDHTANLGKAVTEGRRREFEKFAGFAHADIPDPQSGDTFERSKLNWSEREQPSHRGVLEWYRALLALRKTHPALRERRRTHVEARALGADALLLRRRSQDRTLTLLVSLRGSIDHILEPGVGSPLMSSEDPRFEGEGRARFEGGVLKATGPVAVLYEGQS